MLRHGVKRLFRFPFRTARDIHDDVAEELRFHVEARAERLVAEGLPPEAARAQAVREFGDQQQTVRAAVTHQTRLERRRRIGRLFDDLRQDVVHAGRALRRAPGFAATAVGILTLGIGATTALFSVLSAVLLRPLPYPGADRLVEVWGTAPDGGPGRDSIATPDYRAFRDRSRSFDALAVLTGSAFVVTGGDSAEFVLSVSMSASTWRVLGVRPILGRTFADEHEQWGRHRVVVISEGLWKRRFGADPRAIGSTLQTGPQSFTILGVMPGSFDIPGYHAEAWVPMAFPPGSFMDTRRNRFATVLGRLKAETTIEQARDDLSTIAAQVAREEPQFNTGRGVSLDAWQETIVGDVKPMLILLFGAVVLVLLVSCANLGSLLIARASGRRAEMATRWMLGAGRGRLVRQALTETFVLALLGGGGGLLIAAVLVRQIPRLGPIGLPRMSEVSVDASVMVFAFALTLVTALTFGLWPALRAAAGTAPLQRASRWIAGGRLRQQSRRILVVSEVALSLVLLIGAALLVVSLQRLNDVDPGFDADRMLTAVVTRYRPDGRERFVEQLVADLAASPGVRAAAATTSLPLSAGKWTTTFSADGQPLPASIAEVPLVMFHHVTPGYLAAMGATIRRGRGLTADDRAGQPLVAVVNESLARRVWPAGEAIGKQISIYPPEPLAPHLLPLPDGSMRFPRLTVVGVIGDFRHDGLDREVMPGVFVPLAQATRAAGAPTQVQPFHYVVARTAGDPLALAPSLEAAARRYDRNAAVSDVRTMESRLSDSVARRRFAMLLLGGFAALSLVLAVVGLYGVLAYAVSHRRAELGVRAALGATSASLIGLVMAEGLRMTLAGAAIGVGLSAALSGVVASQLFDVRPIDLSVYAGITAMLLAVAGLACWMPAARAARIDPATALRSE